MDYGRQFVGRSASEGNWEFSQAELSRRVAMTQPGISRLEPAGTTPTPPLLARLAEALEADLDIRLAPLDGRDDDALRASPSCRRCVTAVASDVDQEV
ncbi:helix-turn-helix transcriptional regulator [Kitasatospora sp. RB6PN24]|nr:helix-turn-helix transcriptional regulator [Kitasatospora humi]MCC9309314.1 helix-turn-helix transcriptional regulator [Kitasatospora humi]